MNKQQIVISIFHLCIKIRLKSEVWLVVVDSSSCMVVTFFSGHEVCGGAHFFLDGSSTRGRGDGAHKMLHVVIFTTSNSQQAKAKTCRGTWHWKQLPNKIGDPSPTRKRRQQWKDGRERKKKTRFSSRFLPLFFLRHDIIFLTICFWGCGCWRCGYDTYPDQSQCRSMQKFALFFVFGLLFSAAALLYIILERCDICMYKFQLWSAKDNPRVAKANCQARNLNKQTEKHTTHKNTKTESKRVPTKNVATFRVPWDLWLELLEFQTSDSSTLKLSKSAQDSLSFMCHVCACVLGKCYFLFI